MNRRTVLSVLAALYIMSSAGCEVQTQPRAVGPWLDIRQVRVSDVGLAFHEHPDFIQVVGTAHSEHDRPISLWVECVARDKEERVVGQETGVTGDIPPGGSIPFSVAVFVGANRRDDIAIGEVVPARVSPR